MFQFLAAMATALSICYVLFGVNGVWLFSGAYLLTWWLRRWAHHRLGGITGDIIGFVSEMTEVCTLLLIVAMGRTL